jgi:hypothetical protein
MTNLYPQNRSFRNNGMAVERLSDHVRMPTLPWPARRLTKRFGLGAATARVVAEMIGYAMEDR